MALGLTDKKYVKVTKGGVTYNCAIVNVKKGGVTYNVWKSGSTVTYIVDTATNAKYTEEVDNGATCLAPTTFTPSKSGWEFVGWREDTTASGTVLTSKVMDSDPITLYAVYSQVVTCTFVSYESTQTAGGTKYYNASGNFADASITVPTGASWTGWSWRGWSANDDMAADASVVYANGATISNVDSAKTYYGLYQQTITLTTIANGSTTKHTNPRYHNSYGNTQNPSFTVSSPTRSGWDFLGWSSTANSTEVLNTAITDMYLAVDATRCAVWDCADVSGNTSLSYNPGSKLYTGNETQATILSNVDTSKYSAVKFTFASGNIHINTSYRGTQIDLFVSDGTNKTCIGYAYNNWDNPGTQYDNQGIVLTPTLTFASSSGTKNVLLTSECHTYGTTTSTSSTGVVYVIGVNYTLIGRTVVY